MESASPAPPSSGNPTRRDSGSAEPSPPDGRASRHIRLVAVLLAIVPTAMALLMNSTPAPLPPLAITADRPSLVFSEYLFDYGPQPVAPQPLLTPTIEFRNMGRAPVTVGDITASCGCVQPRVSATRIAPGAIERITIPIKTTGEQPGPREYSVTIAYTDTRPREATLTVRVVLPEQQVVVEPRVLGIVGGSSRAIEHAVTVTDLRDKPLFVESVLSSSSLVAAEILRRSTNEGISRTTVAVRINETTPPGIHRAVLQFNTDDAEYPQLHLPVLLQGEPRPADQQIAVKPEMLRLSGTDLAASPQLLRINVPADWQVSHIEAFPTQLRTSLSEVPASAPGRREFHVQVLLESVPPGHPDDGVISLVANDGEQMVSVPVMLTWPLHR